VCGEGDQVVAGIDLERRRPRRHPPFHEPHDAAIESRARSGEDSAHSHTLPDFGQRSRYHQGMRIAPLLLLLAAPAYADTFGGFSGVDRPYLVNQDRVCTPILIANGAASGMPKCQKAAADLIARLSIKPAQVQSGAKAAFTASASGTTLTITRKTGEPLVAWDAPDPIGKVIDVFASQYEDRIAVAYTTRRAGKELTDVVAFDLGQAQHRVDPVTPVTPATVTPAVKADPKVTAAVDAARKAAKPKAEAAWQAVLAIEPAYSEAHYQLAALHAGKKDVAGAVKELEAMTAPDAIEWQIEARFDAAFAALRADPKFRAVAGLDRKPANAYERMMGFGGTWEQTGTSCDKPQVTVTASRSRAIKIRVKSACEGAQYDLTSKGTWRVESDQVVITIPTKGKQVEAKDEAACKFEPIGDEDSLRCALGRDLEFQVLPTRR
jgi:hypothetical protein